MAGGKDIQAGKAYVSLYVDQSGLVKGMRAASQHLQSFGLGIAKVGGMMMGLGGAVLAPLGAMVKGFSDAGSVLADMSARTGVSTSTLSSLGFAAQQTGASMEDLEIGIRKMQKGGFKPEQMGKIADKLMAIKDPSRRAAEAMKIFGKSGTMLLPMLANGSKGLAEFQAEAQRLGIVMSDEDAAAADQLGDAMDKVKATLAGVKNQIGAALAPACIWLAETLAKAIAVVIAFVQENRQLVVKIAAVAVAVVAFGSILVGLGATISLVGMALSGMATILGIVLSPVAILVGLIVGATAAFLTFTETGQEVTSFLQGEFASLFGFVQEIIGGISDALTAGEWKLAAAIAWAGVVVAWEEAKLALFNSWNSMLGVWDEVWIGMASIVDGVMTTMQSAWNTFFGWIAEKLLNVWGIVEKTLGAIGMLEEANTVGDALRYTSENAGRINKGLVFEKQQRDQARVAGLSANAAARGTASTAGVTAAKDELAKLIADAHTKAAVVIAAREAAAREKKPVIVKPETGAGGAMGSAATFSSSALAAMGQGGGPMDRLVKINEDHKKVADKQLKEAVESKTALEKLSALLTIA